MKKSIRNKAKYFLVIFCFATIGAKAQSWEWANNNGGSGNDQVKGVSTDPSGNVYTTGSFTGTATFGPFTLTGSGSTDIFVAKQNKSGTYLWAVKAGGTGVEEGTSIAVDAAGNSFVTGNFNGTATFGTTTLTSAANDGFLARYDNAGTLMWVVKMGGASTDRANKVSLSGGGNHANVCVTGFFNTTATFGTTSLTSAGAQDLFVVSYTGGGIFNWAKRFGGTGVEEGTAIAQDPSANIYLTGSFTGTVSFGSFSLTSGGGQDIFTSKLDANGNVIWAKQGSGSNSNISQAIAVDDAGNTYVSGITTSNLLTFGSLSLPSSGGQIAFIVKYSNLGLEQWTSKVVSGVVSCSASGLAINDAGNFIYITGYFSSGLAEFQSFTLYNSSGLDSYVSRYNSSGVESLIDQALGFNDISASAIAINELDYIYVVGSFSSSPSYPATFGSYTISTLGALDGFVASFNANQWPVKGGGGQRDYAADVAVDNAGNSYVTGVFSGYVSGFVLNGSATFGSTTIYSTSLSGNAYIAKYNASGKLEWVRQGGCTSATLACSEDFGTTIAVDPSGNSYVGGAYSGTSNFDGITLSGGTIAGTPYVAKYNTNGTIQWAINPVQHGGSSIAHINSITCDASSNLYVTGSYSGTVTIGSNVFTSPNLKIFIFKLNSAGVVQWAISSGGTGTGEGFGIATNGTNVFITGRASGTTTFGGFSVTSAGGYDVFIAKYSVAGVALGLVSAGSSSHDYGNDITADLSGNVYLTGGFEGTVLFGSNSLTSTGGVDVFTCKYNSSLTCLWAKKGGGTYADAGNAIQWSPYGLFVTGYSSSNSGSFGSLTYTGVGLTDVFVTKYNQSTGLEMMLTKMGGASYDFGYGIGVDGSGYVYVGGSFKGTGTFGPKTLTSLGGEDMFLEKIYGMDGTGAKMANLETLSTSPTTFELQVYPNPSYGLFNIEINSEEIKDVFIYDQMGKVVRSMNQISDNEIQIDITDQPAGIYIIQVVSGNTVTTHKLIKQ